MDMRTTIVKECIHNSTTNSNDFTHESAPDYSSKTYRTCIDNRLCPVYELLLANRANGTGMGPIIGTFSVDNQLYSVSGF